MGLIRWMRTARAEGLALVVAVKGEKQHRGSSLRIETQRGHMRASKLSRLMGAVSLEVVIAASQVGKEDVDCGQGCTMSDKKARR